MHIGRSFPQVYPRVLSIYIYIYLSIYLSQNHSPSQGQEHGHLLSEGSLSVMHLFPCWSMHSWLCFQHNLLSFVFSKDFAFGNAQNSQVSSRHVQTVKIEFHQSSSTRRRSVPGILLILIALIFHQKIGQVYEEAICRAIAECTKSCT